MRLIVSSRIFQSIPSPFIRIMLEEPLAMDKTRRLGHANFM